MAILDSAYRGGQYSKITFIARPLHIMLHFLHLCTLKIGLKLHVSVLKILGLAMPIHMSTFHQDFPQLIFDKKYKYKLHYPISLSNAPLHIG